MPHEKEMTSVIAQVPLVSVCIQTYQHASFITQTIESVLMQKTDFPVEILLGEDESTDGTREICLEFADKYPDKIRLFLNERKNVIYIDGQPTGRWNFMNNLKQAKGKYIALLPGDDYWTSPDKLQRQVEFLEKNTNYSLCFHDVYIHAEGQIPLRFPDITGKTRFILTDLFDHWFIPTCSAVFRNKISFPSWFTDVASGDIALLFLAAEQGDFHYMHEALGTYRRHPGGISRTHIYYKKVIDMTRLYHYIDLYFEKEYREFANSAIKADIEKYVVAQRVDEIRKQRQWLRSPLIRAVVVWLRRLLNDKSVDRPVDK